MYGVVYSQNSTQRFYQKYEQTHVHAHTQLLLLLLALIPLVRGGYELRVRAHSYSNPSHQHARGGCCDFPCHDHCDNYFLFCLRSANYSHSTWTCPLGVKHTGEVGGDSLTFESQIGRQQNPMLFSNSGNWPVSFTRTSFSSNYHGGYVITVQQVYSLNFSSHNHLQPNKGFSLVPSSHAYPGEKQSG